MKKILLVALCILAAAAWLILTRGSEPVSSPAKENPLEVKDKVAGSKDTPSSRAARQARTSPPALTSDCLEKKEVIAKCTKAKGGKSMTSPPLKKEENSLSAGDYSRLPE